MAHRKHLSQEGHAASEIKGKKEAAHQGTSASKVEKTAQKAEKKSKKEESSNPHIKSEHGEY